MSIIATHLGKVPMINRRRFLSTSAAAGIGLAMSSPLQAALAESSYLKTIGLQLWTVRNQMNEDSQATLKAIADAGYQQVELMNVMNSVDITKTARNQGLDVTSAFVDWQSVGNPDDENAPKFDRILETAQELKLKHLVFGYIGKGHRETPDHFKAHAERANVAGEKCKAAGIQLCYHNHSFEFATLDGDKTGFDIFVDEFDKDLVKFEIDVFWVKAGGRDPFETMKSLKGRMSQVHLKDLMKGSDVQHDEGQVPHEAFKELGAGSINMKRVMNLSEKMGVEQCHVEQDQSSAPLESIVTSIKHLKSLS